MKEVIEIPGGECTHCPYYDNEQDGCCLVDGPWPKWCCGMNRGENTERHCKCPYGDKLIKVTMTNEEVEP